MKPLAGSFVLAGSCFFGVAVSFYMATAGSWSDIADRALRPAAAMLQLASNDPRQTVDARLPPYAAIGKFKGTMTCTGSIALDPRIVVTAGHCVADSDGRIRRSKFSFWQAYQVGTDLGRFNATLRPGIQAKLQSPIRL